MTDSGSHSLRMVSCPLLPTPQFPLCSTQCCPLTIDPGADLLLPLSFVGLEICQEGEALKRMRTNSTLSLALSTLHNVSCPKWVWIWVANIVCFVLNLGKNSSCMEFFSPELIMSSTLFSFVLLQSRKQNSHCRPPLFKPQD